MKNVTSVILAATALAVCVPHFSHAQNNEFGVKVSVLGAVTKQGSVRVPEASILSVLAESSGWSRHADLKRVTILRRKDDGTLEKISVNVAAILNGEAPDTKLQRGDVVHVPEKIL